VGVCGSDIHYFTNGRIGSQVVRFPFIIGHEAAGIVERTAKNVTRVEPGQMIAIDPAVSCGQCDQCRAGRENTCRKLLFLGAPKQLDGCMREYLVIPERCCYPIADTMTLEQAALAEPLSIALYTVEKSHVPPKAAVAVLGCGPIGMAVLHALRAEEAGNVYVTDKVQDRLAMAGKLRPRWSGQPDRVNIVREISALEPLLLDVVYECSGDPAVIGQAVQLLKPGGRLVLVGIPDADEISFPIHELRRKEITVVNIRRQANCTRKAVDMLASRRIVLDALVTHRFRLEEAQEAFRLVADYRDGVMKAMISID
jgi:L-iditol 2-dehydrogenase